MNRTLVQGIIGLILAALATWLTQRLVDQIFGPEGEQSA
jgi:hypothetical protein